MIYEKARVLSRYNKQLIWVETQIKTTCSSCQHNSECGTGVLARAMTRRTNQVLVECKKEVSEGETVVVSVTEQNLVTGAALLYGLPLFFLMASLVLASLWVQSELMVLLISALTTTASFMWVKHHLKHQGFSKQVPKVVDEVPSVRMACPD